MEIKSRFDHFNINVTNLERSITFYEKALLLHLQRYNNLLNHQTKNWK